jgi:hypothetical protein
VSSSALLKSSEIRFVRNNFPTPEHMHISQPPD